MKIICTMILSLVFVGCDISENSALTNYCNKQALATKVDYRVEQAKLKVTYMQNIKPSMDQHCMSCHAAGQHRPDLTSWEDMKKSDFKLAKLIVKKVREEDMPKVHPLDAVSQEMYAKWQADGFLHTQDLSGQMDCGSTNTLKSNSSEDRREDMIEVNAPGSGTFPPSK